jgi:hypothetical protein
MRGARIKYFKYSNTVHCKKISDQGQVFIIHHHHHHHHYQQQQQQNSHLSILFSFLYISQ